MLLKSDLISTSINVLLLILVLPTNVSVFLDFFKETSRFLYVEVFKFYIFCQLFLNSSLRGFTTFFCLLFFLFVLFFFCCCFSAFKLDKEDRRITTANKRGFCLMTFLIRITTKSDCRVAQKKCFELHFISHFKTIYAKRFFG